MSPRGDDQGDTEDPDGNPPAASREGGTSREVGRQRPRAAIVLIAAAAVALAAIAAERGLAIRPTATQRVLVSRGGEVVHIDGPGQSGFRNPLSQFRLVHDMALAAAHRSLPDRGMPALSAEGHVLTAFGTAFWREGEEADLRWRFAHIRDREKLDLMLPLMAASVQAVTGRHPMDAIIRDTAAVAAALTEDLRARARALLRVEVADFALTRIDPGEGYRAVVAEREPGRARAASVAASPALTGDSPDAVEVERIHRWDGRGIIPESPGRADR